MCQENVITFWKFVHSLVHFISMQISFFSLISSFVLLYTDIYFQQMKVKLKIRLIVIVIKIMQNNAMKLQGKNIWYKLM